MDRYFFVFNDRDILLEKCTDGGYTIPYGKDVPVEGCDEKDMLTVTALDGSEVIACYAQTKKEDGRRYEWCGLRQSYYKLSTLLYRIAGKCEELLYWHRNNRFCGVCGTGLEMHTTISKRCPKCGKEIWPLLATAVIVLVHRGNEVLLVHARNFRGSFFGLVAGFVETGESLEEAVHREVMEETGIRIDNLRYFGSQPWPYPCGLMVGFHADYVDGEIRLQEEELAAGAWFERNHLPEIPEKLSIARRLIDDWLENS